ncbi:MAG: hypothetical protein ACJ78H_07710, partial [Chloroflexota bacterium]
MPELPVREVRLPELHLPEIDREQIISSLSGLRLPAVDLPAIQRPGTDRDERSRTFDWRAIDWPAIDLGPALAGAGALVRLGSRARPLVRSRWAVAGGIVVLTGLAAAAILSQPVVRERAGRTIRTVRDGVRERLGSDDALDVEGDLADTEADVETVETEVVTAADVVADMTEADAA